MTIQTKQTCKDRVREMWNQTIKEWETNKNDSIYLNECFVLSSNYVSANTFTDQKRGYHRIQFSWGGPSDELRIFKTGKRIDKIEYWFLDWFDGASLNVTKSKVANEIVNYYMA